MGGGCGKLQGFMPARIRRKVKKVSWEKKIYKYEIYST